MRFRDYFRLGKKAFRARLHKEFGFFDMPYKYSFILTNVCQSQCKTCKIWKIYEDNPELQKRELETEQFKKIIDSVSDEMLWLNFVGGEPFLFPDIVELAEYAFENCPYLFMMNIPTNAISSGHISSRVEQLLEVKPEHIQLKITISLDGLGDQHNKIRGVEDNWERAMDLYEDLKEYEKEYDSFEAGFQTTVSQYNIDNLEEIFDFTKESSLPVFTFAHESFYFNNEGDSEAVEENVDKEDLIEGIEHLYRNYPVKRLQDILPKVYLKLAKSFYKDQENHVLPPSSGRSSITFDPYGNIKSSPYVDRKMGSLKDNEFNVEKVLKSEKARKQLERIDKNEDTPYWMDCEAYPTIFQQPFKAFSKAYLR